MVLYFFVYMSACIFYALRFTPTLVLAGSGLPVLGGDVVTSEARVCVARVLWPIGRKPHDYPPLAKQNASGALMYSFLSS